jgi:hypothetical protein
LGTLRYSNKVKASIESFGKLPIFSGKSIICFGGEDWWYHHPHSKNHLMRRFARAGNKVIFNNL